HVSHFPVLLFFFSSRRRHTRFSRDWSSDVCSSDLGERFELVVGERRWRACRRLGWERIPAVVRTLSDREAAEMVMIENLQRRNQIGRASCRERVEVLVVEVSEEKK